MSEQRRYITESESSYFLIFLQFFLIFFTTQMNFRDSTVMLPGTLDLQVIIKLSVLLLVFLFCLPKYKICLPLIKQLPLSLHIIFIAYLFIVSTMPQNIAIYSSYALLMHFVLTYITVILVARCGADRTFYYYFISVSIFSLISLIYYYILPEIGRYSYIDGTGQLFQSTRMSGIAGHPNTLGFMTATSLVTFTHLVLHKYKLPKISYIGAVIIFLCLVLTDNRTSIGGAFIFTFLYITIYTRSFSLVLLTGSFTAMCAFISFLIWPNIGNELLVMASRSGNPEEITSLTGRSNIWSYMLILIEQKPVFGWGHAKLGAVLSENRDAVGFFVAQAHNLYLQILFSGGLFGLFLFILGYLGILYTAFLKTLINNKHALEFCLLFLFILSGFTESIMIASVVNNAYFVFLMCLATLSLFCLNHNNDNVR